MTGTWSQRVERHYSLVLPADVRAWLDGAMWAEPGGAEFCRARTPEQLLDPEPGELWAGFMMPDTLPLIGNDYGDWLCLRIARDGGVSELVHWSHCGGDWIPYGRSLAEGLLYDMAVRFLQPAGSHLSDPRFSDEQLFRPARWACQWLEDGDRVWRGLRQAAEEGAGYGQHLLDLLVTCRVAEMAVRRDRILRLLESPLKTASDTRLAQRLGVVWEPDFVSWVFDTDMIPTVIRRRLEDVLTVSDGLLFAQDWHAAEQEARAVIGCRPDLGWAFDVAGWAAQRRGDPRQAVQYYLAGMRTSWFSDDTVRFRTHWFEEGYGKFAAARLATLVEYLDDGQRDDPYLRIFLDNNPQSLRARVHQHWLDLARAQERQGAQFQAYQCYYRAGWDLGLQSLGHYEEIFAGLQRTAAGAGADALAALARMYQRFLHAG